MSVEEKLAREVLGLRDALYAMRVSVEVTRLQKRVVNQRARLRELELKLRQEQTKSHRLENELIYYRNAEFLEELEVNGPPKFEGWMTAGEEEAVKAVVGEIKRYE